MLNIPPAVPSTDNKWARISAVLVGLMWVFPFLYYRHENPLTTFDQEWWCAMLGLAALTFLLAREFWQRPEIPRIAQFPAALIVVVMLQLALAKIAYFNQALLYILYFLFAALLMVLGARLRDCLGLGRLAQVLAIFLSIGPLLNAVIGVIQHFHWHTPLDPVITAKISSFLYGNIAQHNHFADYMSMGLISLGLLFQQGRLKAVYLAVLAALLLFVMVLSGSRSSWLYLLMMTGLAWWWARRDRAFRPLLQYSLLLVAGFGLMHLVVQLPFVAEPGSTNTIDRLSSIFSNDAGQSSTVWMKFYMWHEAWLMFMQSPWLGVGFGQFAWHHFQLLPVLRANYIFGFYTNAHNLIFQLAAVTGLGGLLALLVPLGIWLHGQKRAEPDAAHWWGYALLGVLAIHSMLEYPLWYAYFAAIAAILLGAFDETRYHLKLRNTGRFTLAVVLLLGLVALAQLHSSYRQMKDTLAIRPVSGNVAEAVQKIRAGLVTVYNGLLLSPYAEMYIFSTYTEVDGDHIKQKLALGNNVMHFIPIASVVYRQAFFLAEDGQLAKAEQLLEQAIWSYPGNGDAHELLLSLAEKDPAHFSALLKFAAQKEQEHARAVRQQ